MKFVRTKMTKASIQPAAILRQNPVFVVSESGSIRCGLGMVVSENGSILRLHVS